MQVGGELILAILLLVGLFLQCFCVVASNCLRRFSSTLTDVHMDASSKLATFPLEEEVLTSISPNMSDFVGYNFNILGGYFTTSRLYLHLNCFLNSFPSFTSSPDASNSDLYMEGKIFKIKNAMVKFISIEYSKPKILTWNLHHHSPSYLAILFCLREALVSSPYTSPRPSSPEQYSSLIVW